MSLKGVGLGRGVLQVMDGLFCVGDVLRVHGLGAAAATRYASAVRDALAKK